MNISVKKFSKKSLSLLIALIMVFSALPLTPPISAEAATAISTSDYGLMAGNGSTLSYRVKDQNTTNFRYNVCNDGSSSNFTSIIWKFDISSISASNLRDAFIEGDFDFNGCSGCKGINFYAVNPNNSYLSSFTKSGKIDTSFTSGGTSAITAMENKFSEKILIGTFGNYSSDSSKTKFSLNLYNALKSVIWNGWSTLVILAIPNYNTTHATDGNSWSDICFKLPQLYYEVDSSAFNVTASNNENSVTNRVRVGDAIYTYAGNDTCYNYGKVISTDKFWYTPVTVKSGTLSSVVCVDDNNSRMSVTPEGKLSGTFSADKFTVSGNSNVFATLKFTFSDGKIEYHKVAVKSYPIESHASIMSYGKNDKGSEYTLFVRNSTGSGGTGTFVDYRKYLGVFGTDYFETNTTGLGKNPTDSSVMLTSAGKKAGVANVANGDNSYNPGTATYYIDKSCATSSDTSWKNLGNSELWSTTNNNYTLRLDFVRTVFKFTYYVNKYTLNTNNTGATVSGSYASTSVSTYPASNTNGQTTSLYLTKNSNIGKASTYNFQYNIQMTNAGSAVMRANIEAFVFDKSAVRNLYVTYLNEDKQETNYTASSFAAYQNALLEAEAYLSNYEETTEYSNTSALYNYIKNAHDSLIARGDTSKVDTKKAEVMTAFNNSSLYTTSSHENFSYTVLNDSTAIEYTSLTPAQKRDLSVDDVNKYYNFFNNALNSLQLRADFTGIEEAVALANQKLSLTNVKYTDASKTALTNVLNNSTYANYSTAQKNDTPDSEQWYIDLQKDAILNKINALVYDKTSQQEIYNNYIAEKDKKLQACYSTENWNDYLSKLELLSDWLSDDTKGIISNFEYYQNQLDDAIATMEANHKANHYKYTYDSVNNQHTYGCENGCSVDTPIVSNCTYESSTENHISTVECSVCHGNFSLDYTAYDALVEELNDKLSQTAKYSNTEACKEKFNEITALSTPITNVMSQADIEALLGRLNDEVDKALTLAQYQITFNVVDELGNTTSTVSTNTVDYGTLSILNLPEEYKDYVVTSWKRNINNADSIVGSNMQQLQVIVKSNAVYSVHIKNTNQAGTEKQAVITLNNKSNKVADIGYVAMNPNGTETKKTVTVDTDAGTIKIGDTTLTAPKYSFYNLDGFEIDGKRVASGETITINSKMVIKPVYTPSRKVTITRANADILINGKNVESVDVEWNKKIVMTYDGEVPGGQVVIWKDDNGNILAQGTTYSFYANSNVTISASVEDSAPTDPTASIGYFDYDSTLNKVTVVNNFYVPDGMKASKAGVILSTKSTLATMNNEDRVNFLKAQTNGKFEGDESQFTTDKNQIRISVSRTANTSFTMYALAYVEVGGQTYYAPTVQSITYTVKNS